MSAEEPRAVIRRRGLLSALTSSWIAQAGLVVIFAAGTILTTTLVIEMAGRRTNPYFGMLACLVVPAIVVVGLILVWAGATFGRARSGS